MYINTKTPLWIYHKTCGHYFKISPNNLFSKLKEYKTNCVCIFCNKNKSEKNILNINKYHHGNKKSAYSRKHMHLIMLKRSKNHFYNKFHNLKDCNEYLLIAPKGYKEIFTGMKGKYWFYHKVCKNYSYITIANFFKKEKNGHPGCTYCAEKMAYKKNKKRGLKKHICHAQLYNHKFLKRVYNEPDNEQHQYVPLENYKGMREKILWLHWTTLIKPHTFLMSPNSFLNDKLRCPKDKFYIGEFITKIYLNKYNLIENVNYYHSYYLNNNKFLNKCLRLDFFIPNISFCKNNIHYKAIGIEYDGVQHFIPIDFSGKIDYLLKHNKFKEAGERLVFLKMYWDKRHSYDIKKNKYCKKHNIYLIRIEHKSNTRSLNYDRRIIKNTLQKYLLPILLSYN